MLHFNSSLISESNEVNLKHDCLQHNLGRVVGRILINIFETNFN